VTKKLVECSAQISGSALKLDKFGNLHYISKDKTAIMRIPSMEIMKVMNVKPRVSMKSMIFNVTSQVLYSNYTTSYIYSLNGITLEREYLYWTNTPKGTQQYAAVAKAFAEPFIHAVPLQTFNAYLPSGATSIAANSAFLFF
jgi:hypothetical protein